jgi:hypothetical protein
MNTELPADRSMLPSDAERAGELRLRRAPQPADLLEEIALEARVRPNIAPILAALPFDPRSPGITLSALALRTRSSESAVTAAIEYAMSRQLVRTCRSDGVPKHRLSGLGLSIRDWSAPGRWDDFVRIALDLAVLARRLGWSPERLGQELERSVQLEAMEGRLRTFGSFPEPEGTTTT